MYLVPLSMLLVIVIATTFRLVFIRTQEHKSSYVGVSQTNLGRVAAGVFMLSFFSLSVGALAIAFYGFVSPLGSGLTLIGAAIIVIAQIQMGPAWRIGVHPEDASVLIEHGLYKYSRNPIFSGMSVFAFGVALICNYWWGWIALCAFVMSCHMQISIEEKHLKGHFGELYSTFSQRVPRWIRIG